MFNLKYNFLAGIQALIGVLILVATVVHFGLSNEAHSYLVANSIVSSYFLLLMMVCEQFQYKYRLILITEELKSNNFFNSYLILASIVGVIFYMALYLVGSCTIIKIILPGLVGKDFNYTANILDILSLVVIFYLPYQIFIMRINGDDNITLGYILSMLPNIFQLIGVATCIILNEKIILMAYMTVIGYFFSIGIAITKVEIKIKNIKIKNILECVIESFKIKGIHNIHNYITILIVNHFISMYSNIYGTIFLYLRKITETVLQIVYGPTHKLFINKFSILIGLNKTKEVVFLKKKIDLMVSVTMTFICITFLISLNIISDYIQYIDDYKLFIIINLILLMAQILIQGLELPSAVINLYYNKYYIFLISNVIYIIFLCMSLWFLKERLNFYALSASLAMAQIINLILIRRNAGRLIYEKA